MKTKVVTATLLSMMMLLSLLVYMNATATDVAAQNNLPLIVIADTQMCQRPGTSWAGHRGLIEHINARASNNEIGAIVTAGDNVDDDFLCFHSTKSITDQWDDILTLLAPARSKLGESNVVYVPGNHEKLDTSGGRAAWDNRVKPKNLSATTVCSNATGGVRGCGSFDTGNMHIAFLKIDKQLRSQIPNIDKQLDWLKEDLRTTTRPWKIVVFHYPSWGADVTDPAQWWRLDGQLSGVTHSSEWQIETSFKQELHTIFKNSGVRLVINGHRHAFNVFVKDGIHYVTAPTAANGFEVSINPPGTSFQRAYTSKAQEGSQNENQVGTTTWAVAKQGYLEILPSGVDLLTLKVYVKDANGNVWAGTDIPYLPLTIYYPPVMGVDAAAERTDPSRVDFFRKGYRYEYRSSEGAFYLKTLCTIWNPLTYPVHPPLTGVAAAYDKDGSRYFYTYDDGDPDNYGDRWKLTSSEFTYTNLDTIWGKKGNNAPPVVGIDSAYYDPDAQRVYFFGLNGSVPTRYTLRVTDITTTFEASETLQSLWAYGPNAIDAVWRNASNTYFYQGGTRWTMSNTTGLFITQNQLNLLWGNKPVNPDNDICLVDPRQCTCAPTP